MCNHTAIHNVTVSSRLPFHPSGVGILECQHALLESNLPIIQTASWYALISSGGGSGGGVLRNKLSDPGTVLTIFIFLATHIIS